MMSSAKDSSLTSNSYRTIIFGEKALLFKKMYLEIQTKVGGRKNAIEFLNSSEGTIGRLYKGRISYENASKILNKYKELNGR